MTSIADKRSRPLDAPSDSQPPPPHAPTAGVLDIADNLILGWLVRNGHERTFSRLPAASAYHDANLSTLSVRAELMNLVRGGQIVPAIALVRSAFPLLTLMPIADTPATAKINSPPATTKDCPATGFTPQQCYFLLLAQQFIELIRQGNSVAALTWAQTEMIPMSRISPALVSLQEEALGLLVYAAPMQSPVSWLLDSARWSWLATLLNSALVLDRKTTASDAPLEDVLKHVLAIDRLLQDIGGFGDDRDDKRWRDLHVLLAGTGIRPLQRKSPIKTSLPHSHLKAIKND